MARAILITNPVAARHDPAAAAAVARIFRARGWVIDLAETRGPGDARRLAAEAVERGADLVAVFGGDGTTMQAAAGLVGTDVPLGLVPGGTGNILAGNLRIPFSPVAAAEVLLAGRPRRIDLGRVERPDGLHYFGVACGAGADARIMGETMTEQKRRWGIGGYLATLFRVLPGVRSTRYTLTVDGKTFEFRAAVALVLNCGELIPPLIRVRRHAEPDDGILDLIVLSADSMWQCARGVLRALQNVILDTGETSYLVYGRGKEITIDAEPAQPVQFDGDLAGATPVTATVVPGAIRVMVRPA